jgi:putative peptidoglycan lipid II flippase
VTLFQGGAFDEQATQLVFAVLVAFSGRIVAESTLDVVARLFYARHNTFVPMIAYLGWLIVTIAAIYALVDGRGVVGLALATTLSFTLLALTLLELNRRALGGLGGRTLPLAFLRAATIVHFFNFGLDGGEHLCYYVDIGRARPPALRPRALVSPASK